MRKFIALLLCLTLILSLAGCSKDEPKKEDTNPTQVVTEAPTATPTVEPTEEPTIEPTAEPINQEASDLKDAETVNITDTPVPTDEENTYSGGEAGTVEAEDNALVKMMQNKSIDGAFAIKGYFASPVTKYDEIEGHVQTIEGRDIDLGVLFKLSMDDTQGYGVFQIKGLEELGVDMKGIDKIEMYWNKDTGLAYMLDPTTHKWTVTNIKSSFNGITLPEITPETLVPKNNPYLTVEEFPEGVYRYSMDCPLADMLTGVGDKMLEKNSDSTLASQLNSITALLKEILSGATVKMEYSFDLNNFYVPDFYFSIEGINFDGGELKDDSDANASDPSDYRAYLSLDGVKVRVDDLTFTFTTIDYDGDIEIPYDALTTKVSNGLGDLKSLG